MTKLTVKATTVLLCLVSILLAGCSGKSKTALVIDMTPIYKQTSALDEKDYTPYMMSGKEISEDSFVYETELLRQIFEQSNVKFKNVDPNQEPLLKKYKEKRMEKFDEALRVLAEIAGSNAFYFTSQKAEENKKIYRQIEILGTAINVYYAKYSALPGFKSAGTSSKAIFTVLKEEQLIMKDTSYKVDGGYWNFIGCSHTKDGWNIGRLSENSNICLYASDIRPGDNEDISGLKLQGKPTLTGATLCLIESNIDDENPYSGEGQVLPGVKLNGNDVNDLTWNCGDTTKNQGKAIPYLYRIF